MAISEHVRLIIEIVNAPQGSRALRTLEGHAQNVRNAFASGRTTIAQFQQSVQTDLSNLEKFTKQSATRFRESASGIVLPATLAEQTEQTAQRIVEATGRVEKANQRAASGSRNLTKIGGAEAEMRKRANLLLIDYSRITQDAAFGVRAMVNNLDPLILNTERYFDAVSQASGGTATFTQKLAGLGSVLAGPAGLLVLINALFLIGATTDLFDPVVKMFNQLRDNIKGAVDAQKQLNEEIENSTENALQLREGVNISDSIGSWRSLNHEIANLSSARTDNTIYRIAAAFGSLGGSEIDGLGRALGKENEKISAEISRLEKLQEVHKEAVKQFRLFEISLVEGGNAAISEIGQDIINRSREATIKIIENRRRDGQQQINLEEQIARARNAVVVKQIEQQIDNDLALRHELYATIIRLEREFRETQDEELRRSIVRSIIRVEDQQIRLQALAASNRLVIEGLNAQLEANLKTARENAGRDTIRFEQDLASEVREITVRNRQRGVDEKIALLRLETDEQKRELQRQLDDWQRQYGGNGELARSTREFIEELEEQFNQEKKRILEDDAAATRDHAESLKRIQEGLAQAYGASTEAIISAQIARARAELELIPEEEVGQRRKQIQEITNLEAALEEFRIGITERERQRVSEHIFFQRELFDATNESQSEIQRILERGKQGEIQQLREREQAIIQFIQEAKTQADRYAEVIARINEVQKELALAPIGSEKFTELTTELSGLTTEIELVEDAIERYRQGQFDLLDVQKTIAKAESSIWDQREKNIERFLSRSFSAVLESMDRERQFTAVDIELQRFQLQQREEALNESLAKQEISNREHDLQLRKLAQDRAEFEKSVEEDRKSFLVATSQELTQAIIEQGTKRLAKFIADQVIQVAVSKAAIRANKTAVVGAMGEITAAAAPAAAATSIATAGGSALAGVAAAVGAIAAIIAAIAAVRGFEKGGYTGGKRSDQVAGVVHGGEFVMTQKAVRGQQKPFYALMRALEQGLDPNELMLFLAMKGMNINANPLRIAGFGFQEGGFAAAATSLRMPDSFGSSHRDSTIRTDAGVESLRAELRGLRSELRSLADAPRAVVVSRRTQADLVRGGSEYIEGRRSLNPNVRRR